MGISHALNKRALFIAKMEIELRAGAPLSNHLSYHSDPWNQKTLDRSPSRASSQALPPLPRVALVVPSPIKLSHQAQYSHRTMGWSPHVTSN